MLGEAVRFTRVLIVAECSDSRLSSNGTVSLVSSFQPDKTFDPDFRGLQICPRVTINFLLPDLIGNRLL
jgi:hypothetical protein